MGGLHTGGAETLTGLLGTHARLAYQHHAATESFCELIGVLGDQLEGDVVGTADVH